MAPEHTLIALPQRKDARGLLTFGQRDEHLPFPVKRIFLLSEVAPGASRGGHAHREQHQLLIMANGSTAVTIDNGAVRKTARLDTPNLALHAPPMLWLDIGDFSKGSVCLVLASDIYDEGDYIRDYSEFLQLTETR